MAKAKSNTRRARAAAKASPASKSAKSAAAPAAAASTAKSATSTNISAATEAKPGRRGLRPLKRLRRKEKPAVLPGRIPNVFQITRKSMLLLWSNWRLFLGIAAIYAVLNFILVQGFGSVSALLEAKDTVNRFSPGLSGVFASGFTLLGVLATTRNTASADAASAIQFFVVLVTSLAIIWSLRHVMAGEKVRVRDGFYQGMTPLIPVFLLTLLLALEVVPFVVAGSLFSIVIGSGIAISVYEIIITSILFFVFVVLSLYLLTSSIIAVYIATLPDMTPVKSLRSANDLVRWRRWNVLRKLIFLPIATIVVAIIIMFPVVLLLTPIAPYIFFALSMVGILVVHAYLYTLYRELLA